jgi:predicted short-subunit dehydrogenase-like oxidoreductase (DUF2520 family)
MATGKGPAVLIYGAGKVGAGLTRALRAAGAKVTLRAARQGLPARPIEADVIVLALRDRDLAAAAATLVERGLVGHRKVAVLHCAGALGPEVLAAARGPSVAVAQMHPMISFAATGFTPSLTRGQLHVDGDPAAMKAARAIGRLLGMTARTIPELDRVAYHAAAGLVANGAAALAAGGVGMLGKAGVAADVAAAMLGPLLRSVAENMERLGLPEALTGPVRRGDATGVGKHLDTLARIAPDLVAFYVAAARVQVPLARALGDAPGESFDAIEERLGKG